MNTESIPSKIKYLLLRKEINKIGAGTRKLLLLSTMYFILGTLLPSCKMSYSFSGASISPEVKTFTVKFFSKTASLGPASLSQTFTEKLKDKFISQTTLAHTDKNGDLTLEGSITNYSIVPISIQANELAAQNRLTISVTVKFTNLKDEKQNFETSFSRYKDFPSTVKLATNESGLSTIEEGLISEINEELVDDIFNKAVINW